MSWNPAPIYGSAQWNGNQQLATKNQLVSSIAGLYLDIQDIEVSTITVANLTVSTLTAKNWISTPELYVSSIIGATLDISGISINENGVFNAPIVSLSTMSFKGFDSLLDLDVSFDLGLGNAIGGLAAGLGALVGGAAIAVGTGVGLAVSGAEQGIATMVAGRPQNFISQTNYETINFTTQLQLSTLGNAYPLYSTILRTVSSTSADQVPGKEIFVSTFFTPGTTCIRAVSDPFNLITGDSNLNTSTIQSFGQWTPFLDPTVTGEDISARNATFSTLNLVTDNTAPGSLNAFSSEVKAATYSNFINQPFGLPPLQQMTNNSNLFMANQTFFSNVNTYISTPFAQFTSSITTLPGGFYQVPSSLTQSLSLVSWDNPSTDGNFVLSLDSLGNKWLSTGQIDIRTNPNQSTLLQYGYLINTYIPQGSTVRLTFDYNASVSSIITRPEALSTIAYAQQEMVWGFETNPYELQLKIYNQGTGLAANDPGALQIQASTFVIGATPASSAFNQPGYAYQFDGNTFVNGTLGANIIQTSNLSATVPYQVPLTIETGATNSGALVGDVNRFYIQTTNGIIFSDVGSSVENASLYLGTAPNQSLLNVSSINSMGNIKANSAFFSSLTVESLTVISTINVTSTNIENITTTSTLIANDAFIQNAYIDYIDSFAFNTGVGNPSGLYDINKNVTYSSTIYDSVSSLTNNILSYTLNLGVQNQTSFNMGGQGQGSPRASYQPAPQNVEQWASSIIVCNPNNGLAASLFLGNTGLWTSSIVKTGTFDLIIDQTKSAFYFVSSENQNYYNPTNTSSFLNLVPAPGTSNSYRFTLNSNGWWGYVSPAPPPYESVNSNTFTISQDINDVFITATDRMNFKAGDFIFDGNLAFQTLNTNTLFSDSINTSTITADVANLSTIIAPYANISSIFQQNNTWGPGSQPPNMIEVGYSANIGFVSSLASTQTQIMTNAQAGYINNYVSQISTTVNRPVLTFSFGTGNSMALGPYGALGFNGGSNIFNRPENWAFGTIVFNAPDALTITMINYGNINVNGPILNLSNAGSVAANLTLQGIAGTTSIPPGVGTTIVWNQTVFQPPAIFTPWAPYVITDDFQINQSYRSVEFDTQAAFFTGSIVAASNVVVDGSLRTIGQITTYVPSVGYAGIEVVQYDDTMVWSMVGGSGATWESAAQNLIPRPSGGYYKSTDWTAFVSPITWSTPDYSSQLNGWVTYTVNQTVGGVQCLALYRLLTLIHVGGPSPGNFNVQIMMIPKNFTTND